MPLHRTYAIFCCLTAFSAGSASAQPVGQANPYAGHSVTGSGVQLLGIEPFPGTGRASVSPPDLARRVTPVQYPLDNRAYEGPDPTTPQGYPMYAPGVTGISPGSSSGCATDTCADDDRWVRLGSSTWEASWVLGGNAADDLGIVTNEFRVKLESPRLKVLTASPRFGWHLLDGPAISDLPAQLYDASVEAVFSMPIRDQWFLQAAVSPSLFTDGQNLSGDAFRLPSRLLVFWTCTDKLTLSGGIVYLDRENVSFLPSAGAIWKPSDDWRIEAIMPRPRVAWRYDHDTDRANWLYVVGEFGGGSWAIEPNTGLNDVATLTDYRCLLGWEQIRPQGLDLRLEGGLVFNRSLEYLSTGVDLSLPATGLVRLSLTY